MKKVLVTGGLGYIGSHTVVELINDGLEVVIIDDLSNSEKNILHELEALTQQSIPFYECDIKDYKSFETILSAQQDIDGVIHFAAKKSVPESIQNPLTYYENNITGLINVLKYMEASTNIDAFIFSSSCTVYGIPDEFPVTESTPTKKSPSPYGNTKLWAEQIIEEYVSLKLLPNAVILRYFNPVGAHVSAKIGELPKGKPSNLMPFITQTAANWHDELSVFGNDYDTKDGTAVRDFIHVVDLATAHVKALKYAQEDSSPSLDFFNVGTGNGHTVMEVINSFIENTGADLSYSFCPRRSGDVPKIWANTEKIRKTLHWKPKYDLSDMVTSSWEWQKTLSKP